MKNSAPPVPGSGDAAPLLETLRAELDQLDNALHDTLMRRAEIVGRIGRMGGKGRVKLRPGREAAILRRLLARHRGDLPPATLTRMWRELFAGTTGMQAPLSIAVAGMDPGLWATAREHFGALTPLHAVSPPQIVGALHEQAAAILPLAPPFDWLPGLLAMPRRAFIVAELPFWRPRQNAVTPALVLSSNPPDASGPNPGDDKSWLAVRNAPGATQSLVQAGFTIQSALEDNDWILLAVDGFITEQDPRLLSIPQQARPALLGASAVPVE